MIAELLPTRRSVRLLLAALRIAVATAGLITTSRRMSVVVTVVVEFHAFATHLGGRLGDSADDAVV